MKVSDLIRALERQPPDAQVLITYPDKTKSIDDQLEGWIETTAEFVIIDFDDEAVLLSIFHKN